LIDVVDMVMVFSTVRILVNQNIRALLSKAERPFEDVQARLA